MTQIFQIVALTFNLNAAPAQAQIQTCQWPNTCIEQVAPQATETEDKDFTICTIPNKCSGKAEIKEDVVAETYKPCKWPNCSKKPVKEETKNDFGICSWPNKCNGMLGLKEKI